MEMKLIIKKGSKSGLPDFDPSIIVRDDGSHVVSEALKSFMSADKGLRTYLIAKDV